MPHPDCIVYLDSLFRNLDGTLSAYIDFQREEDVAIFKAYSPDNRTFDESRTFIRLESFRTSKWIINNFSSCDFNIYTLEELIAASQQYVNTGYVFSQQWQEKLEQLSANQQIGFYASEDGSNLCFDDNYNCIGSVVKYLHSLPPDYESLEQKDNKVISTIPAHSKFFFKMAPSNEFVPVEEIKLISEVTKI